MRGRLRVNVDAFFSRFMLAPHLGRFLERYPEISLDLIAREQLGDLVAEGFGMGRRRTLLGAWYVLRANQKWSPYPVNDPDAARDYMRRFYALVKTDGGLSIDPDEAVHVGDSVRDDLEGATKAGLTGVLLDRTGRSQVSSGLVIRTLEELLPLLMASKE